MDELPPTPFGPVAVASDHGPSPRSYWVVAGRLAGGAYPFAAETASGTHLLSQLEDAGLDRYVNLTHPNDRLEPYEPHLAATSVMLSHPIVDFGIPTSDAMVTTLDAVDQELAAGHNPYVHCWGGVGRTGTVICCWLVRHGVTTGGGALALLEDLRQQDRVVSDRRSPETDAQRRFVLGWVEGR